MASNSRIIVKGIPKHADNERIRNHFQAAGLVTDAKVMRTPDGRSRLFAFVGFHSEEEAKWAVSRFNNTYMDTSKLFVEFAKPAGDETIPRAWSKYSKTSSKYKEIEKKKSEEKEKEKEKDKSKIKNKIILERTNPQKSENEKIENDPQLEEFLQVSKARQSKPFWGDDVDLKVPKAPKPNKKSEKRKANAPDVLNSDENSSDHQSNSADEYQVVDSEQEDQPELSQDLKGNDIALDETVNDLDYFKSKVKDESKGHNNSIERQSAEDSESQNADESESPNYSDDDNDSNDKSDSDDDSEASTDSNEKGKKSSKAEKKSKISSGKEDKIFEDSVSDISNEEANGENTKLENLDDEDDVSVTGRLFVRNLAYTATEEDLEKLFEPFGALAEVHLCLDRETKKSIGSAYISYVLPENAVQAMSSLDNTFFHGRILHILPGKPKPDLSNKTKNDTKFNAKSSFKRKQFDELKERVGTTLDEGAQRSGLFMGFDAVAGEIANRLEVSKSVLYGSGESGSAAVRLAVGEAKLQEEARQILKEEGVNIDAFKSNGRKKLTKTTILVKNLPQGTSREDIEDKFQPFGILGRVVVVPSGLIAIVEFLEASSARKAFSALAYTRLRNAPLYLSWAPHDCFNEEYDAYVKRKKPENLKTAEKIDEAAVEENQDFAEDFPVSLFIKNINFETKEENLKKHFERARGLRSVKIATKKNPKSATGTMSLGYGFCEFKNKSYAMEAMKKLQNKVLDGHALELKLSERKTVESSTKTLGKRKREESSKLIVKNVAFEADVKDMRSLFSSFGQVKNVRIPKKFDGSHRGFAFVSFASKGEASAALEALRDTHLYGRHLVIDYAEDEAKSIEELQVQAAKKGNLKMKGTKFTERNNVNDGNDEDGFDLYA